MAPPTTPTAFLLRLLHWPAATWQAAAGAIAAPGLNQRYSGGLGLGAWCNEEPLKSRAAKPWPIRSWSRDLPTTGASDRQQLQRVLLFLPPHPWRAARWGRSTGFGLCGRRQAGWLLGTGTTAVGSGAGIALVEAAGGVVCDYDGSPVELSTGRVVATNAALQGPLLQGLAECQPLPPATYNAEIPLVHRIRRQPCRSDGPSARQWSPRPPAPRRGGQPLDCRATGRRLQALGLRRSTPPSLERIDTLEAGAPSNRTRWCKWWPMRPSACVPK